MKFFEGGEPRSESERLVVSKQDIAPALLATNTLTTFLSIDRDDHQGGVILKRAAAMLRDALQQCRLHGIGRQVP